jgi:hypothetical protein
LAPHEESTDPGVTASAGKSATCGTANVSSGPAFTRLLQDVPALAELHVEEGALTLRLEPRTAPGDVETVLARIAELARVRANPATFPFFRLNRSPRL